MLSAHGIVNQNVSRVPSMQNLLGNTELSETGSFDFLSYFLGLQANSVEPFQGQELFSKDLGKNTEAADSRESLQTISQKKEEPLWNLMFPAGGTVSQILLPHGEVNASEATDGRSGILSKSSDNGKTAQTSDLLENRLLETRFFLETKELGKGADSTLETLSHDLFNGASPDGRGPLDIEKSKGIEKYTEASQLKTQFSKLNENVNSLQAVDEKRGEGRISLESHNPSLEGTKSSEKKRSADQNSSFVILNSPVQLAPLSDGSLKVSEKVQQGENMNLPEVFKKVESMIHHGGGKMTVELSPPELGKLEVDVMTKGNQVEIKIRSENDVAKVALENHSVDLKSAIEGQNLTLHKLEVHVGLDHGQSFQGGAFSAFSRNDSNGFSRQPSQYSHRNTTALYPTEKSTASLVSLSPQQRSQRGSGVDLRI